MRGAPYAATKQLVCAKFRDDFSRKDPNKRVLEVFGEAPGQSESLHNLSLSDILRRAGYLDAAAKWKQSVPRTLNSEAVAEYRDKLDAYIKADMELTKRVVDFGEKEQKMDITTRQLHPLEIIRPTDLVEARVRQTLYMANQTSVCTTQMPATMFAEDVSPIGKRAGDVVRASRQVRTVAHIYRHLDAGEFIRLGTGYARFDVWSWWAYLMYAPDPSLHQFLQWKERIQREEMRVVRFQAKTFMWALFHDGMAATVLSAMQNSQPGITIGEVRAIDARWKKNSEHAHMWLQPCLALVGEPVPEGKEERFIVLIDNPRADARPKQTQTDAYAKNRQRLIELGIETSNAPTPEAEPALKLSQEQWGEEFEIDVSETK